MNLFSFFGPKPITHELKTDEVLPELRGPLMAKEAFKAVMPAVSKIDKHYKFTLITSGEDINHQGRASIWEFFFDFPRRKARGVFTVQPCLEADGDDHSHCCLKTQVQPIVRGIAAQLVEKLKKDRAALAYVQQVWEQSEQTRVALPLEFRDSVEAVEALADQGADWISGDTRMTLSSKVLENGQVVWCTVCWGQEFDTPFIAEE